jgi:acetyl-CoA synthetase
MFVAMVGCAKVGAIIAPLYSDYKEGAIKERMLDGMVKVLVTNPPHRALVPDDELPDLEHIIIVGGDEADAEAGEVLWDAEMARASEELEIEWVDKDFPLFLIYASGQVSRPVGLLHPHDAMRGYLMTSRWVLDLKDGDVLWTHARPGWLLNVVYSAFAPWLCGVESFVTGRLKSAEEFYQHIEENNISVLYTIPTVYKILVDGGEETAKKYNLKRLRHMLSVLEPLFPDVIYAVMRIMGIPIYDTWWTAETGMITIANLPCLSIKPGYLGKPIPGMQAAILDNDGQEVSAFNMGQLALKVGWPAMARGIWGNSELYERYIRKKPWFISGDTAFVDHDNYFFYQGRADNVIITSAGRVGILEIENMLLLHPAVAEAGVIRVAGKDKLKKIKAFISLESNYKPSELIKRKIMTYVQNNLSADTAPTEIEFCKNLPMSKDGQILRRVLKAWEMGLPTGDIAALSGSI